MKNETTAKRLRIAMSNANIKAQELADLSGVNKASISQYVNGTHSPSNLSAGKMAPILGVNPVWLMGFDVPMEPEEPKESISGKKYYFDDATAEKAQELFENTKLRILFDAAKGSRPEDLQMAADLLKRLKGDVDG